MGGRAPKRIRYDLLQETMLVPLDDVNPLHVHQTALQYVSRVSNAMIRKLGYQRLI